MAETFPTDCAHGDRFLFALFYLFWEGCITAVSVTDVVSLFGLRALLL
jgi:hypothetical protein